MQFSTVVSIVKGFKEHICPDETILVTSSCITSSKVIGTRIAGSPSEAFIITKLTPRNNEAVEVNESALKSLVHRVVWESRKSRPSVRATILHAAISEMLNDYNVHVVTFSEPEQQHKSIFNLTGLSRSKKTLKQSPPTPPPRSPEAPTAAVSERDSRGSAGSVLNIHRLTNDLLVSTCTAAAEVPLRTTSSNQEDSNKPKTEALEVSGILYTSDTAKGHTLFNEPEFGDSVLILLT